QRVALDSVAWIRKTNGDGDAVFLALDVDPAKLSGQVADIVAGYTDVIASVVANLEAVRVQLGDLFPGHVVSLVDREVEALRDEERRSESVLLEQRSSHREVRLTGVVKCQDDQLVGNRLACKRGIGPKGYGNAHH